jgi:colanic acid/amylovoran biosynthesis glycosyltransferase
MTAGGQDGAVGSARHVTHLTSDFGRRSQAWIYDLVTLPGSFVPDVVCETHESVAEFPFDAVRAILPRSRRLSPEWTVRQLNTRLHLPVGPYNYWRRTLQGLPMDADVVHAHFGPVGWMAVDAGLAPVVASFYGYDAAVAQVLSYWGRGYPTLFSEAVAIVVEGPAMGERLVGLGAVPARIRVLPLIADVQSLQWRPPAPAGPIRVLMAGRLLAKKGFELGLAALAPRCATGEVQLTVMGDGPEADALHRAATRAGVADAVRFLGFADRASYREVLTATDIFLQPSLTASDGDSEGGAPTTLLDAQALGAVIVASDHADIPFVVDPAAAYLSREGDLASLVDAIGRAIASQDEWHERSAIGRRHVEAQHGPDAVARRRDDIYAEAAESRP